MPEKRSNFLVNFLIRMIVGVILIVITNGFLLSRESTVKVGINPVTIATSGTLGVPGVALLYGIAFYENR